MPLSTSGLTELSGEAVKLIYLVGIRRRSNDAHLPQLFALVEAGSGLLEPGGQVVRGRAEDGVLSFRSLGARDALVADALVGRAVVAAVVESVGRLDDGDGPRTLRRRADAVDDLLRQDVLDALTGN